MRIVFFGSDDFALVHLDQLVDSSHQVVACVTQPDKPKGRGMRVTYSDIKKRAQQGGVPVYQPADLHAPDFVQALRSLGSDLFVVIAYGRFLPDALLAVPKFFSVNLHASLLPKYRGAAPINWAIINGETETGLSIIKMNARMDAGQIISRYAMPIGPEETAACLRERMKTVGPAFLVETLDMIEARAGQVPATDQDAREVTRAPKVTKSMARIDWRQSAQAIHNRVRGLLPRPAAFTYLHQKRMKILHTQVQPMDVSTREPGCVIEVLPESLVVATGAQALKIFKVHMESGKPMDVSQFLRGHPVTPGLRLDQDS
jgi:methionyl-tRNA formyltransferase